MLRAAEMLLCNSSARYWWSGESSNISNGLGSISPCKGAGAGTRTFQCQRTQFGPRPRHTPHEEPHEVHACAHLWQTIIHGLELHAAHHISDIIKRLVEQRQAAKIATDMLQYENQWPRAFNVITNSLECAAARAERFSQYLAAFLFPECFGKLTEVLAGEASHEEAGISGNLTRCAVSRTGRTPLADFLHVFEDARANLLQNEVRRLVCVVDFRT